MLPFIVPLGLQLAAARPLIPPDCWVYRTLDARFRLEIVAKGLKIPVSLAFLPDRRHALLAERPTGRLSILDLATGATVTVSGTPKVFGQTDGGLQDVVLHPDFAQNGGVYLAYSEATDSGNALVVERATLAGNGLTGRRRIFSARPYLRNDNEFGSRLVIDHSFLYVTVGQRDSTRYPQQLDNDLGKVVRLDLDGRAPADNPFAKRPGALPEIWSYGHRNPQGLAINPATGELWEHEHGPRGGDEINLIRPGRNYGWPVITYGIEYSGEPVGAGLTARAGMEQPLYGWVPSIAPSGMAFYTGADFPRWRSSLFLGAMAYRHLNRVVIEQGRVVREERLLRDRGWRVREVRQALDGTLYLGVDSGYVVRIRSDDGRRACARGAGPDAPIERVDSNRPALRDAMLGYDAIRQVVIAVGIATTEGPARIETWAWDGARWTARVGAGPPPRTGAVMTADPQSGIVLFGGSSPGGSLLGDTWRYADSVWKRLEASGPAARAGASIASDFDHNRVILFGGATAERALSAETWRWDGTRWIRLEVEGPPARRDAAMAYDPTSRSVVLFGGTGRDGRLRGDTWLWGGKGWRPLPGPGPSARAGATLIYSWTRNALALIGGRSATGAEREIWELARSGWRRTGGSVPAPGLRVTADQARGQLVFLASGGNSPTYRWTR